jgi:putative acetyltransferase
MLYVAYQIFQKRCKVVASRTTNEKNLLMKIIAAVKTDYDELIDTWEASVRATHDFVSEEDILYFKSLVSGYFDAVNLYLVRENSRVSAFIGVSDYEIQMLFLHPDARGRGIGKFLMQFAIDKHKATKVDVNEQNLQAVGFYKHLGFKVISRSPLDYLGKPYPLLSMELS